MEGMQNNNQQFGNKSTPEQYMMAQKQAYMQRMRQQYLYQQKMMQQRMATPSQQGFIKQTMQSPQQVANQMSNKSVNPMQNRNIGPVNQPINNSPEYNFYKFNQNQQPIKQDDFANKSQVKIQWKFDEGTKVEPQQSAQQHMQQMAQPMQQPVQQMAQPVQQPVQQVAQTVQPIPQQQVQQNQQPIQENAQNQIEEDELKDLKIEYEGQIVDLESMSIEETKKFRDKLEKDREEVIAKLNMILARDPNLNPVRLEDFPYYAMLKKIQKGV